jgi:hypothetical protein
MNTQVQTSSASSFILLWKRLYSVTLFNIPCHFPCAILCIWRYGFLDCNAIEYEDSMPFRRNISMLSTRWVGNPYKKLAETASWTKWRWYVTWKYRVIMYSLPRGPHIQRKVYIWHLHSSGKPSARGYIWATLFLWDINTGTWPSGLGESQELGQWNMVLSPTALRPQRDAQSRTISNSKLQTTPLVGEGATKEQTHKCLKKNKKKLDAVSQMGAWHWLSLVTSTSSTFSSRSRHRNGIRDWRSGLYPRQSKNVLLSTAFRHILGSAQAPI